MRKILQNTPTTRTKLESLPKIYMVGFWANYGVREYPLAKWVEEKHNMVPYVWNYDDHNGVTDQYELVPIYYTTTGQILLWTMNKQTAERIAKALREEKLS